MKTSLIIFIVSIICFGFINSVDAGVYITPATGGDNISGANVGGAWMQLTPITIQEGTPGDIGTGDVILNLPSGFEFNTSIYPSVIVSGGTELTAHFSSITSNELKITVNSASVTIAHRIIIGENPKLHVRPTNANANTGNIYLASSNIQGVIPGAGGISFGLLKTIPVAPPPIQEPEPEIPAEPEQPPAEKPIGEMTIPELKARIVEIQQLIIQLLSKLILAIQAKLK